MKGNNKKRKVLTNLDLFDNTKQCNHLTKKHDTSQLTDNRSNVIYFKTASTKVKTTGKVSLEETALTSILNRANKLKW